MVTKSEIFPADFPKLPIEILGKSLEFIPKLLKILDKLLSFWGTRIEDSDSYIGEIKKKHYKLKS